IVVVAPTLAQAKICHGYILGFLQTSPVFNDLIIDVERGKNKDSAITLNGNVKIETRAANFRTTRGPTLLACIVDEISFLLDALSATPDIELVRAVTPSLIRSGGMLICISSPYRKSGIMYARHKQYFGQDDPEVLIVGGRSLDLNPTLNEEAIERARQD